MNKVLEVLSSDWLGIAAQKWKEIPSLYKKSFLIIFIGVNIAFAFETFSFIVGDHDWGRIINQMRVHSMIKDGRFAMFYLQYFLTGNNILPVLSNLYIFLILSISSVLLCIYWRVPKTLFAFSAIGLLLAIQPYFLLWLWYSFSGLGLTGIVLFIIIGYMLSELAVFAESKTKKTIFIAVPIILFILALGAYPPIINTMAVVFLGRLIIDIFLDWDVSFEGIKNIL
ncbi:MAG: glucosyltransferase domain-containing protein, partial [Elusimicrobiota bacterium]|nr:glucosyltransferase domain-containing protein [Elusimicrobiota bacterium]